MERDEKRKGLIELREQTGMNRKEFAAEYDIPYPTITDWELGHRRVPNYLLQLIAYRVEIEKRKKQSDIFMQIQWTNEDIRQLLVDKGLDSSDKSVQKFLESLDMKYFEEQCIQHGMEILSSCNILNEKSMF